MNCRSIFEKQFSLLKFFSEKVLTISFFGAIICSINLRERASRYNRFLHREPRLLRCGQKCCTEWAFEGEWNGLKRTPAVLPCGSVI